MESFKTTIEQKTNNKIIEEVNKEISDKKDPQAVYNFNINNKKEIDILVNENANKKKKPQVSYSISRTLCCYKKISYVNQKGETIYGLQNKSDIKIESKFCFWRSTIFLIKYFYNISSFIIIFWRLMTNSMFGIKALCLLELNRDYDINSKTGEIYETDETITFPQSLINLYIMIKESRENFENTPDQGILGKGCMRIFHLFYNYIIRLLIFGILLNF